MKVFGKFFLAECSQVWRRVMVHQSHKVVNSFIVEGEDESGEDIDP
jgi:hypothetical protein